MNFSQILEDLSESGLSVQLGSIEPHQIDRLKLDFDQIFSEAKFNRAQVGKKSALDSQVRNGKICWIARVPINPLQAQLWSFLDELKQNLNQGLFLGLRDFEGHYAHYPEGGFYQRHFDAFSSDQKRKVSIIVYLNRTWSPGDGGELRVYAKGGFIDIEPRAGTLVCFMSRELEHEVLPSLRIRESFNGWFLQ